MDGYEIHPLAERWPDMSPERFTELTEDIRANGLLTPVTLYEGKVLDGRNRLRACQQASAEPRFETFEGTFEQAAKSVISRNAMRRDLNPGQRAAALLEMQDLVDSVTAAARGRQQAGTLAHNGAKGKAAERLAQMSGTSSRTMESVIRVKREDPVLYERVRNGGLAVRAAETIIKHRNGTEPAEVVQYDGCCRSRPAYVSLDDAPPSAHVSVRQQGLKRATEVAVSFAPAHLRLQTRGGWLWVTGTDLMSAVIIPVDANVQTELNVTVPARPFADTVAAMTNARVDLAVSDTLNVSSNRTRMAMEYKAGKDFPPLGGDVLTFAPADLREALSHVLPSAATGDTRPVLKGVNVQTNDGKARFACADGFRLAVAEIRADGPDVELILPRKIAKEIVKLLERATEPVALVFDGAQGRLKVSWADIYFPSINGTFPDPEQEITKEWRTRVTVNATDFRRKIKSAHVWAQDNVYSVRIRIEDGAIEVTAWEGQYKASCPANIEGEPNRIAFTGKHLLGALKGVDGDIVFEMTDEDSPGLFRLSNGFIHVIMPMSGVQW